MMSGLRAHTEEKRYHVDEVKVLIANERCELLSTEYANRTVPLDVRFECGCEGPITLDKFVAGQRCSTRECITKRQRAAVGTS